MYDPAETDLSYQYLRKLGEALTDLEWGLVGGWAVYFHVREHYQQAFGREYLRSRDIDVFIDAAEEQEFLQQITELGFKASAYPFRYELIYDREEKRIIASEEAKRKHLFHLIYLFLDVFSNRKTTTIGSWVFPEFDKSKWIMAEGFPLVPLNNLIQLKIISFFQREKLDKELKDACDLYALLFYSGRRAKPTPEVHKMAEKILSRPDLQHFIAEQVLGDVLKSSLVVASLRGLP